METFTRLFSSLLLFVYHCFDRIVINGYLSGLSRPEHVVHFVRAVIGLPIVSKEVLCQRTNDYQNWVESYARNQKIPIEWAGKGVRKEDYVLPAQRRMENKKAYGVYFVLKRHFPIHNIFERSCEIGLWLRHSRELTRVCSPKMSHEFVSDIDRVHVLRGYRRVIWQDLARAKKFAKALLDVASYFFAPRSALHASGVDDARPNPARLRRG